MWIKVTKHSKEAANHGRFYSQTDFQTKTALSMEMVTEQAAEINSKLVSAGEEVRITECWR